MKDEIKLLGTSGTDDLEDPQDDEDQPIAVENNNDGEDRTWTEPDDEISVQSVPILERTSLRDRVTIRQPRMYDTNCVKYKVPSSFQEAITGEAKHWRKAINEELRAHKVNGTWVLTEKRAEMRTLDSK